MMNPPQAAKGFWSIERFVAFVLGPAVTAGAGWLSLFLAKKWGVNISGPEITGIFATGGLSAAGLAYKWLHGRQLEMTLEHNKLVEGVVGSPVAEGFLKTTVHDLEGLAQGAANRAVEAVTGKAVEPPPPPIPSAVGDPAPASERADEGAASAE